MQPNDKAGPGGLSNTSRQSAGIAAAVVAVAMAAAVGIGSLVGGDSASTTVANNAALTPIEQTTETPTVTSDEPDETQADSAEDEATSSTGAASSIAAPAASGESATSDTPAQADAPAATAPSRSNTRRRAPSSDADVSGKITVGTTVATSGGLSESEVNTTVYVALWNTDTKEYVKKDGKIWVQQIQVTGGTPGNNVTFDGLPEGTYGIWEMIPDSSATDGYRGFSSGVDMVAGSSDITAYVRTSVGGSTGNTITIDEKHPTGSGTIDNEYARISDLTQISAHVIWDNRATNPTNDHEKNHVPPAGAQAVVELYCKGEATGKRQTVYATSTYGGDTVSFTNLPRHASDGRANAYTIRLVDYSYTGMDTPDSGDSRNHFYPLRDQNHEREGEAGDGENIVLAKNYGTLLLYKAVRINNGYSGSKNPLTFTITGPHGYKETITYTYTSSDNYQDQFNKTLEHLPAGVYHVVESGYDSMLPPSSGKGWTADESGVKTNNPVEGETQDLRKGQTSIDVVVYSTAGDGSENQSDVRFENMYKEATYVPVTVTKVWDDNNNSAGKRPDSIQVQLKSNGNVEDTVTLSDGNNWQNTWTNKSNLNTYEVVEIEPPSGYDEPKVTKNGNNFTITNTYKSSASSTPELVVNKTLNGTAPPTGQFNFVATDENGNTYRASNDAYGKVTFTDLPPIKASDFKNGNTITRTYTVSEEPGEDEDIMYDGSTYTAVLTATLNTQSDEIDFSWSYPSKVLTANYEDNKDGTGKVTFYSNGSVVKTDTVTVASLNDGDNKYTYEENNEACTITLTKVTTEEKSKPLELRYDEATGKITAKLNGVQLGDDEFTVENSDGLSISGDKIVTIPAPNGETTHVVSATATSSGNTYTAKLDIVVAPKANALQVTYHDLGDGRGWFEVHHNSSDVSNHGQDLSIAPTNGGPECIGYTNGTKAVDFSSANLSAGTYQYKYEVSHGGESVYVTVTVEVTEGSKPELFYELSYTNNVWSLKTATFKAAGNQYDGKTVILVYGTPPNNLNNKVLDVSNGSATTNDPPAFKWAESFDDVVFQVLPGWQQSPIISGDISSENRSGTLYGDPVKTYVSTGKAEANADFQFVSQKCYENEFTTTESSITKVVTSPALIGATPTAPTFVNTKKTSTVDVTVTKVWDDAENQDGIRPDSVSVQLKANGSSSGDVVTLPEGDNWTHAWEGLQEKDASGNPITYTVEETDVPNGYTPTVTGSATDGFTITNTHTPEKTTATVEKIWDDNSNAENLRPSSLVVTLLADDSTSQTVTLNENNNWTATVNNLDKYANGTPITYTWSEPTVPQGYTPSVTKDANDATKTIITNTHTPTPVNLTVTKTVTGAMADMTKEFEFSISVNGGTAKTFKLKHGGQLAPEDVASLVGQLHYGDTVTITETAAAGYTTTYTVDGVTAASGTSTGTLTLNANTTVAFTNAKDSVVVTGVAETIATSPLVHIIAVGLVTAAACVAITRARRERGVR